jgi:hypothetical protein
MSDGSHSSVDPNEPLQFDNAEYSTEVPGRLTCTACHNEVAHTYYEINGQTICDRCRGLIENQMVGGSRLFRFARALLFGSIAALAGFAIYFGILKTTGWQIGLISVLVGFMVGSAVRKGSMYRGGWVYQCLAIFLTYTAIAASYSAAVLPELFARAEADSRAEKEEENKLADVAEKAAKPLDSTKPVQEPTPEEVVASLDEEKQAAKPASQEEAKAPDAAKQAPNPAPAQMPKNAPDPLWFKLIYVVVIIGFSYSIPVIAGLASPVGLIIVGFALWEAWKLNRRATLVFNGPFFIGGENAPPPTELPSHA